MSVGRDFHSDDRQAARFGWGPLPALTDLADEPASIDPDGALVAGVEAWAADHLGVLRGGRERVSGR